MRRTSYQGQPEEAKSRFLAKGIALGALLVIAAAGARAQGGASSAGDSTRDANRQDGRRIVVSFPDHKLALVENGRVVNVYRVGVGAPESPSPTGRFTIERRLTNPTYYAPGTIIPPGPANPLGPRWIGLNLRGYGIHGTNQPGSIGQDASHGCIRMRNRDVEELFALVRAGDVVELHGERDAEVAKWFGAAADAPVSAAAAQAAETEPAAGARVAAER
jgi:lipoprotein-anchoring transpeptidase ErfK/SrfK